MRRTPAWSRKAPAALAGVATALIVCAPPAAATPTTSAAGGTSVAPAELGLAARWHYYDWYGDYYTCMNMGDALFGPAGITYDCWQITAKKFELWFWA